MQKSQSVVIADDNLEMCELVTDILTDQGYEVDSVHNGYELLDYLQTKTPKVIILDLFMPEKDGISILGTLKVISPYSGIIIYTGHEYYENSVYAKTADRFVSKTASVKDLIEAVKDLS
ncbi:MAG: response regulator [Candidatus Tantalella remota]|nr:response regulator [Candidatus Tantalella remota]